MINLEKDYRPVDFDDKDILTDAMWEGIYGNNWIPFCTSRNSYWTTYFFFEERPYKAVMDKMRGNHIKVTSLDGNMDKFDNIGLKLVFMACNEDKENPMQAICQELENCLVFSYYLKIDRDYE